MKHIKEHPFPAVTIFPDNRPHYFRRDSHGSWTKVDLPNNNDSTPDANVQAALQQVNNWASNAAATTATSAPNQNDVGPPQTPTTPWGTTITPRYGSIHLDCRLKTHLAAPPMVNTQHYDNPLLNPAKDRFIQTWQTSQL